MDEDSETVRAFQSWEESIYWTHFHSIHFCQFLRGDFRLQLALPKKFAENMKNKLGENVLLKGPSGSMWKVALVAEEDGLFFKGCWEEFVNDHLLAENDVLMFKYIGNSRFEVLIFDHQSLCEKEASYFCKRWGHREREGEVGMKTKAREGSEVVTQSPLPQGADCAPIEENDQKEEAMPSTVKNRRIVSRRSESPEKIENERRPIGIDLEKKLEGPHASSTPLNEDKVLRRRSARNSSRFRHIYVSSKKTFVKTPQQSLTIQRAQAAMKNESFIVIMQPTHVYKRFYLSIPVKWADKHLGHCNQNLILRTKDKTWNTRYNYTARNCGGICSGWKNFALDNHLLESDVCLFDFGGIMDGATILDVSIFRTNDIVPTAVPKASAPATNEVL